LSWTRSPRPTTLGPTQRYGWREEDCWRHESERQEEARRRGRSWRHVCGHAPTHFPPRPISTLCGPLVTCQSRGLCFHWPPHQAACLNTEGRERHTARHGLSPGSRARQRERRDQGAPTRPPLISISSPSLSLLSFKVWDVVIVGAGIAGCALAHTQGKVREKRREVRTSVPPIQPPVHLSSH